MKQQIRPQRIEAPQKREAIIRNAKINAPKNERPMQPLPTYGEGGPYKICIIQPGSYGDNINSTLMLIPMRKKWPDATIDVYTTTQYETAFHNNPSISNLYSFQSSGKEHSLNFVHIIPNEVKDRGYNLILNPHPMINGDKWTSIKHGEFGTNLICAWVRQLEHNDIEYDVPLTTILRLTQDEIDRVNAYCKPIPMAGARNILIECGHESGQSHWTENWTSRVTEYLMTHSNTNVFLSIASDGGMVHELLKKYKGRVWFAGGLSIRECAELYNRCNAFFSVSSGLSNACNTNWCKKDIKWIESINSEAVSSAPIRKEGKIFFYQNDIDRLIEIIKTNGL